MLTGRLISDGEQFHSNNLIALLNPVLRKTTVLLWLVWLSCAFCYYGVVLLSTELIIKLRSDETVTSNCESLKTYDIIYLLWISLSEFPGIFVTFLSIKRFGKKVTMVSQYLVYVISIILLSLNLR